MMNQGGAIDSASTLDPNSLEPGVIARQSSICYAGVPIKKRKFPLVRPPSPPLQEPSFLPMENDSVEDKHSGPSQESSLLSASVAKCSFGKSGASKNFISEVNMESPNVTNVNSDQNNVNFSGAKPQEPSPAFYSGSMDNVVGKEKLMLTEKSAHQIIPGSTELHLAANEALSGHVGIKALNKQQGGKDCKLELHTMPGNVELSLGLKEPLVPIFASQTSEGSRQMSDKLDPSSLCLSLSQEQCLIRCKSGDVNSKDDSTRVHANRSNWDLNTALDAWEGSVGAGAGPDTVGFHGLSKIGGTPDIKPFISSTGMVEVGIDTGKLILEAGVCRSNILISSLPPSQQYNSEDSIHLSLGTSSFQSTLSGEQSGSSGKIDSGMVVPNSKFLGVLPSTGNKNSVGHRTVKSEPCEENVRHDCVGARSDSRGSFDMRTVKCELVERCSIKALSDISPPKVEKHRSTKSEPVQDGNQEIHRKCRENVSSTMALPSTPPKSSPSGLRTYSDLSTSGDVSNHSEHSTYTKEVHTNMDNPQEACARVDQVPAEMVTISVGLKSKESNASDGMMTKYLNVDDSEACRLDKMNERLLSSRGDREGSESDEEKINISADILEEDFYGSDYESDGNHARAVDMDTENRQYSREDDEYEDGEVREPLVHTEVEGSIGEDMEAKNVNLGDYDNKKLDSLGCPGGDNISRAPIDEKDSKMEDHAEISECHIKECVDDVIHEKVNQVVDKDGSLRESLSIEMAAAEAEEKGPIKATPRRPLDQSGRKDVQEGRDTEVSADGETTGDQGTEMVVAPAAYENIKRTDALEKNDSSLLKTEASLNGKDATAQDANGGGSRSRIINLPRASNVTSPCKTRCIPDRSLLSGTRRGRYVDFDGERLYPRMNREEFYSDGPNNFVRERMQDRLRNSRLNFVRGRGRISSRLDTLRGEWDSDCKFAPEIYNGPADHRFPRYKRTSVGDTELECNGYVMAPDRRKPLSDALPSFRHPSSRRLSPRGRGGPTTRGFQMVRRIPRNISPNRCTGEDGSDLVELRYGEKLMRGLPDDIINPVFTRTQPPYERLNGQFARGNRNFSSVQRRGLPRIRSKSPIRSRTRSPGPWSSPRRRSPDGVDGLPELTQQRSPVIYRMQRIRSPDRLYFPKELVARRRGSPPCLARPSNDMREMDSGRVHGHPRTVIPNRRSPSDRGLPRSTRRFDILDRREKTDGDEYFRGPMRTGRSHELIGDGSGDEIRKCGERRGLVRSFRPPFNSSDGENFHFHLEDGPRPFRFCPEDDSEFIERSNLREREFDRQIKDRPVVAPRRTRGVEGQEGNYRLGGQVWHDDGSDDVSRMKRRRF